MDVTNNIVLYVDDEENNLQLFHATFERDFKVLTATNTIEARKIMSDNNVKIVVSDLRMPEENGIEFIQSVYPKYPNVFYIILTAYLDSNEALSAINHGNIFRYILKPWNSNLLRATLTDAIFAYDLKLENKNLVTQLKEKNTELENTMLQLKEREKQFYSIFQYSSDGIIIYKGNGQLQLANPAFYSMMELNEVEDLNLSLINNTRQSKFYQYLSEKFKKSVHSFEYNSEPTDGNEKFLEINSTPIDYFGELVALSIIRDITERKLGTNRIFNAVIQAEERERNRLAGELHDGLGPNLSAIKMYIEWISDKSRIGDEGQILELATNSINESIQQVRNISHSISPHKLEKFGLIPGLQSYIELLKQTTNIEFNLNSNVKNRLKPIIELTLYRILKECINNTIKHANAKNVFIVIAVEKNKLSLIYSDNGIGFDTQKEMEKNQGIGLYNIQNRISSLGGTVEITSAQGLGTRIKIELKNADQPAVNL